MDGLETDEEILGCRKGATLDELRASYFRLAKQFHPDKRKDNASEDFLRIQKAFDRARQRIENSNKASPPQPIDLDDMTFDETNQQFTYACRCGDGIIVSCELLAQGADTFTCPSCSLRIKVDYEMEQTTE